MKQRPAGELWTRLNDRFPLPAALGPGVVLLLLGLLAFGVTLDSVQEQDDLMVVDEPVLDLLVRYRNPVGTSILHAITLVSGPIVLPVLIGTGALVWGIRRRRWWRPILMILATGAAVLIASAVKRGVQRPRPPVEARYIPGAETTFSFPSGHTIGTATLCLVTGYLVWSRHPHRRTFWLWVAASAVGTFAVGLSRLYLGYHFVTDVIGAFALAVAVLGLVVAVDRLRGLRRGARLPPARSEDD